MKITHLLAILLLAAGCAQHGQAPATSPETAPPAAHTPEPPPRPLVLEIRKVEMPPMQPPAPQANGKPAIQLPEVPADAPVLASAGILTAVGADFFCTLTLGDETLELRGSIKPERQPMAANAPERFHVQIAFTEKKGPFGMSGVNTHVIVPIEARQYLGGGMTEAYVLLLKDPPREAVSVSQVE